MAPALIAPKRASSRKTRKTAKKTNTMNEQNEIMQDAMEDSLSSTPKQVVVECDHCGDILDMSDVVQGVEICGPCYTADDDDAESWEYDDDESAFASAGFGMDESY